MKSICFYVFLMLLTYGIGFLFPPIWIMSILCGLIAVLKSMKRNGLC